MDQTKLFGTSLAGFLILFTAITESSYANSISIFTLNSEISSTDDVFVTGFVSTEKFYKPVTLEVYDPEGELLYGPKVNFNENGQFSWLFHPPNGRFEKSGPYTIFASHEDVSEISTIHFKVTDEVPEDTPTVFKIPNEGSQLDANGFFDSIDFLKTNQEIPKSDLPIKTSKSTNGERNNSELEFLESNGYVFAIIIMAGLVFGVVKWVRARRGNAIEQKDSRQ